MYKYIYIYTYIYIYIYIKEEKKINVEALFSYKLKVRENNGVFKLFEP